jgi:DNA-binding transcriptional ArsR family regulator
MEIIMNPSGEKSIDITWDCGTGYDFFYSIYVLHSPEEYGLRGMWAAGVRSRLAAAERKFLELSSKNLRFPIHWLYSLPLPKEGNSVLHYLRSLPAEQRLPNLFIAPNTPKEIVQILQEVSSRGSYTGYDKEALQRLEKDSPYHHRHIKDTLEWWARPAEFGEQYLSALESYNVSFFAEEERRIRPYLTGAVERSQELAARLPWPMLLEELSQGVRFAAFSDLTSLVLIPSYWSTPLVFYEKISSGKYLVLFGARPADASLVPGEVVPDALLRGLKAVADPTRLRIMRYLANEALTPAQLARRLRLRAPTVIHHLNALRLAGLVKLTLEDGGERRYTIRQETVNTTFSALQKFISAPEGTGE